MQLLPGVWNPATAVTVALAATAIIFISSMPLAWSKEQLSSRECEDLGFTGLALCSDCHTLAEYIKDQGDAFNSVIRSAELVADCLKCCAEDSDDATSKITYSGAVLEVCMRKLVFYPEIVGFIEEDKDQFPSVKVQYTFNSPPKLILLDDEGQHKESIRIDNWKREHFLQFLQEKVKRSSAI
ncbi:15 kDa selenoprotein [Cucumis melo var. makuwa]|uniref:Selenoprotein F n=1 Tax=Cucumis melo var. makuwa TaxID=1194695 RepID=A0A5A7T9G4_CUCMM|nr:15 kDa selenoprotein [Cucumis melo var. makuwa]TYK24580.1 15 kDa selenoprotein [Cucumis melo var. makuwa]